MPAQRRPIMHRMFLWLAAVAAAFTLVTICPTVTEAAGDLHNHDATSLQCLLAQTSFANNLTGAVAAALLKQSSTNPISFDLLSNMLASIVTTCTGQEASPVRPATLLIPELPPDIINFYAAKMEALSGIKLRITMKSYYAVLQEVVFQLQNGLGTSDAWIYDTTVMVDIAEATPEGGFLDLTEFISEDDSLLNFASVYKGKVVGMPFMSFQPYLFYRLDIFAKYNLTVPTTWDEFVSLAERMNGTDFNGDGKPDNALCFHDTPSQLLNAYHAIMILASHVQTNGPSQGVLWDPATMEPLVGTPAMRATLRLLQRMSAVNKGDTPDDKINDFRKCLMTVDNAEMFKNSWRWPKTMGAMGVAMVPGSSQVLDRSTMQLVPCTPDLCHDEGGRVNRAPTFGPASLSVALNPYLSPAYQKAGWHVMTTACGPELHSQYFVLNPVSPIGPIRLSTMDTSPAGLKMWTARGYNVNDTRRFLTITKATLDHRNRASDISIKSMSMYHDILDDEVTRLFNTSSGDATADDDLLESVLQTINVRFRAQMASEPDPKHVAEGYRAQLKFAFPPPSPPPPSPLPPPPGVPAPPLGAVAADSQGGQVQLTWVVAPVVAALVLLFVLLGAVYYMRKTKRRHRALLGGAVIAPMLGPDTTLLLTDIEGSTHLFEAVPEAMDQALVIHNALMHRIVNKHTGYASASEGDGFIIAFHSAVDALGAAAELQELLLAADWPAELLTQPLCAPVWMRAMPSGPLASIWQHHVVEAVRNKKEWKGMHSLAALTGSSSVGSAGAPPTPRGPSSWVAGMSQWRVSRVSMDTGSITNRIASGQASGWPLPKASSAMQASLQPVVRQLSWLDGDVDTSGGFLPRAGGSTSHRRPQHPGVKRSATPLVLSATQASVDPSTSVDSVQYLPQIVLPVSAELPYSQGPAGPRFSSTSPGLSSGTFAQRIQHAAAQPPPTEHQASASFGQDGDISERRAMSGPFVDNTWNMHVSPRLQGSPFEAVLDGDASGVLHSGPILTLDDPHAVVPHTGLTWRTFWAAAVTLSSTRQSRASLCMLEEELDPTLFLSAPCIRQAYSSSRRSMEGTDPSIRPSVFGAPGSALSQARRPTSVEGLPLAPQRSGVAASETNSHGYGITTAASLKRWPTDASNVHLAGYEGGDEERDVDRERDRDRSGSVLVHQGLRVRMGAHSGLSDASEVTWNAATGRHQYGGQFLSIASAICNAANGGMILVSQSTFKTVCSSEALSESMTLLAAGEHYLKNSTSNVSQQQSLYEVIPHPVALRSLVLEGIRSQAVVSPGYQATPCGQVAVAFFQAVGVPSLMSWDADITRDSLGLMADMATALLGPFNGYLLDCSEALGVLAAFSSTADAIKWALVTQQALLQANWHEQLLAHRLGEEVVAHCGARRRSVCAPYSGHNFDMPASGNPSPPASVARSNSSRQMLAVTTSTHEVAMEESTADDQTVTHVQGRPVSGPLSGSGLSRGFNSRLSSSMKALDTAHANATLGQKRRLIHRGLRTKCGIDVGHVRTSVNNISGRMTCIGKVMNRAARVTGLVKSSQVWCSAEAWDSSLPTGFHPSMLAVSLAAATDPAGMQYGAVASSDLSLTRMGNKHANQTSSMSHAGALPTPGHGLHTSPHPNPNPNPSLQGPGPHLGTATSSGPVLDQQGEIGPTSVIFTSRSGDLLGLEKAQGTTTALLSADRVAMRAHDIHEAVVLAGDLAVCGVSGVSLGRHRLKSIAAPAHLIKVELDQQQG